MEDQMCFDYLQRRIRSNFSDNLTFPMPSPILPFLSPPPSSFREIQSTGGRRTFLDGFGCKNSTCNFPSRFSCFRTITSLAPIAQVGKATGRDSINLLSLIGIPAFNENGFPGCFRHLNIAPILGMLKTSDYINLSWRSSYLFLNPLQLLAKDGLCLRYAANFAKQGAFKAMGPFAAEMCAPYCLSLVVTPISDIEAKWTYILLKEVSKCLKQKAVK
ncbi:unnamed protein product [Camellia sinensis]